MSSLIPKFKKSLKGKLLYCRQIVYSLAIYVLWLNLSYQMRPQVFLLMKADSIQVDFFEPLETQKLQIRVKC